MKTFKYALCALGAALALAGCGGDSQGINRIKVVGDSIADSGTFGFKWAMQGSATEPMQIWTERIAAGYGAPTLCPRYIATSSTNVVQNPNAVGCNSYAVGGGRINMPTAPTSPFSIPQQLKDLAAEKTFSGSDLLLVDGGGNDAADLAGAFLGIPADKGAAFAALVSTLVPAGTVSTQLATGTPGVVNLGGLYMTALADKMHDAIKTSALDQGAQRVLVLNIPGITNTPRFLDTLDLVALASGGGAAGATARAQTDAVIKGWIVAFNKQLATRFAGNNYAVVVDFYALLNDQAANPAKYGLTNVRTPACPVQGIDPQTGLAIYNPATCTTTLLSATTPPAGATGGSNWWRTYAFSDGFHPTLLGYKLLADQVSNNLKAAGWL